MSSQATVEMIAARLAAAGFWVSLDYRTNEAGAAALIGCCTRTLRKYRAEGTGPAFLSTARITYRIGAILAYLASRESSPA